MNSAMNHETHKKSLPSSSRRVRHSISFKILSLVFLVASSLIWITGLSLVIRTPRPVQAHVPVHLSLAVWELDAAIHRLISTRQRENQGDSSESESRLSLAIQKLKAIEKQGSTNFHSSLDVLIGAALGVKNAVETDRIDSAFEHAARFRDAAMTSELGILPAEEESRDDSKQDGVGYLVTSGLFLIFGYIWILRRLLMRDARYRILKERTTLEENEMQSLTEKLVATENQVAAMRGLVDAQLQENRRLVEEIEGYKSEVQRHLLSRSASERELERLLELIKSQQSNPDTSRRTPA